MDQSLSFLEQCSNEQIRLLCDVLLFDNDGQLRFTEMLSVSAWFKSDYPNNLLKHLPEIIHEYKSFAGNTIANMFRSMFDKEDIPYLSILEDVCTHLKVNFAKGSSPELMEYYMLQKILIMSVDKMTDEDVHHFNDKFSKEELKKVLGTAKMGSPIFLKLTGSLVLSILKKRAGEQVAAQFAKFIGGKYFTALIGPLGWVVTSIWTLFDIAGPAYRVVIPATISIAYLRMCIKVKDSDISSFLS